jgi:hypothetical protein
MKRRHFIMIGCVLLTAGCSSQLFDSGYKIDKIYLENHDAGPHTVMIAIFDNRRKITEFTKQITETSQDRVASPVIADMSKRKASQYRVEAQLVEVSSKTSLESNDVTEYNCYDILIRIGSSGSLGIFTSHSDSC